MPATSTEVTRLLQNGNAGDKDALDKLSPLIFDDVRDLARRAMTGEAPGPYPATDGAGRRGLRRRRTADHPDAAS